LQAKIFKWFKLPVTQLLEADPTAAFRPDRHGSFPAHVAASADSMASLIAMLTSYPDCAVLRNAKGQTFLHVAVEARRVKAAAFVCHLWGHRPIAKSVVNIQDGNGDTALHLAVRHGELDMCRHLIGNRHARINLENNEGETPMDLAVREVKSGFYFGLVIINYQELSIIFRLLIFFTPQSYILVHNSIGIDAYVFLIRNVTN